MYVSVFLGPFSRTPGDDKPLIDFCLDQAQRAADAGFAMVTFGEQHFNNYEPYSNPFLMAARLSPSLGDCWFGTTIVPLVFHHPLRLAEDSSVIDLLLGGRFIMGMSAGRAGFSFDFENFGMDPATREDAFESKLGILQRAYRQGPGDPPIVMDTPYDSGQLMGRLMPIPYRAAGPLLAVGTNTDATVEKTAQRGLSLFLGPCLPREAAAKMDLYRSAARAAGRDAAEIEQALDRSLVTRHVIVAETEDTAWDRVERMVGRNPMMDRSVDTRSLRELSQIDLSTDEARRDPANRNAAWVQSWVIAGSPDSVTSQLLAYPAAGVPQVNTRFTAGIFNPAEMDASFSLFLAEVLPHLDAQRLPGPTENETRVEHTPAYVAPAGFSPDVMRSPGMPTPQPSGAAVPATSP